MTIYQRAGLILAREGVSGLCRRTLRKVFDGPPARDTTAAAMLRARVEYDRLVRAFPETLRRLGVEDCRNYYWYHTIDLGDGLVTPGDYDYRDALPAFRFPADMTGMDVLDVGSATGFFAFEFERRGGRVVSVELPSLADWDIPAGVRAETLRDLMTWHGAATLEEAGQLHLERPFEFCRRRLGSQVRRCYSTVYDLSPAKVGADGFDFIFLGDVLPHTWAPLPALDRLASLCRGTLVISQDLAGDDDERPALRYIGGGRSTGNRSWFLFNWPCLEQVLRKVGFNRITRVGRHAGILRRAWCPYDRAIVYASK
jgi:SAM-dependent methyltransferase